MKTLTHDQDIYDSGLVVGHESGLKEGHTDGLIALVSTLKQVRNSPEEVLASIVSQKGFENTTMDEVKKYW